MSENYKLTLVPWPRGQSHWVIHILIGCEWVFVEDQLFFEKRHARAYAEKLLRDMV